MTTPAEDRQTVAQIAGVQGRLLGYILALLPDRQAALDVLQETNLAMWEHRAEFAPGSDFGRWACRMAYFRVMSFVRDRRRDRHRFDSSLMETLAPEVERATERFDLRLEALGHCLSRLPAAQQQLIRRRYGADLPLAELASEVGRKRDAVAQALVRIRGSLLECIRRYMQETSA